MPTPHIFYRPIYYDCITGYNRRNVENDIALLKLDGTVDIGSSTTPVKPVCLPANNQHDFSGLSATVAGKYFCTKWIWLQSTHIKIKIHSKSILHFLRLGYN
jgi:hypothetical protein